MSPIIALQKYLGEDCCGTGRSYQKVTAREMKEFKDSCSDAEWKDFCAFAIEHMTAHEPMRVRV